MLRKLFGRSRAAADLSASRVPPGLRVYAVGDVHGRLDLLNALVAKIDEDTRSKVPATVVLIFLGDVIDRGPESSGVLDRLIEIKRERPTTRFLLGNHEEMFLAALNGDLRVVRAYCRVGGRETLLSYGVSAMTYERMEYADVGDALSAHVPERHRRFVEAFEDIIILGDYAFVHAGVDGAVPLAEQKTKTLRWIREPFLTSPQLFEKIIVHGHTISHQVEWRYNRVGIDTGAYQSGTLSAICLEADTRSILQASSSP